MSINLIPTKLIIPKRQPGVIRRSRLVEFLHEHLERKLLFVTAPAGYGKTTLLVDFAGDVDLPVTVDYNRPFAASDHAAWTEEYAANVRPEMPRFEEVSPALSDRDREAALLFTPFGSDGDKWGWWDDEFDELPSVKEPVDGNHT